MHVSSAAGHPGNAPASSAHKPDAVAHWRLVQCTYPPPYETQETHLLLPLTSLMMLLIGAWCNARILRRRTPRKRTCSLDSGRFSHCPHRSPCGLGKWWYNVHSTRPVHIYRRACFKEYSFSVGGYDVKWPVHSYRRACFREYSFCVGDSDMDFSGVWFRQVVVQRAPH